MGKINFKKNYKTIGNNSSIFISENDKDLDGLEIRLRDYVNKAFNLEKCSELDKLFESLRSLDKEELEQIMDSKVNCIFALRFPNFTSDFLVFHIRYYDIYFKLYNQIKKILDIKTDLLLQRLIKEKMGIDNITVVENLEYVNQYCDEIIADITNKINSSNFDQTRSYNKLFIADLMENIEANIYYSYFSNFRRLLKDYYSNVIPYAQGEVTKRLKKINNINGKIKSKKDKNI